jgi:cholesterol oxidase
MEVEFRRQKVCLLERGKEMWPGDYPEDLVEGAFELQVDRPSGRIGKPTALYDFRFNDEMHVWIGCGLGGTSLVNANVTVVPDKKVFDGFPPEINQTFDLVERGYKITSEWLQAKPVPDRHDLPKSYALKRSGTTTGGKWLQPPLAVSWDKQSSTGGIQMNACINCGNCVTGCNNQSKNTTLMNYIPDAHKHGCEIFCQVEVKSIEKQGDIWIVHGISHETSKLFSVRCKTCIIAGGSLGSTELLLRSKEKGLECSSQVGKKFTGNGDVLGFAYNGEKKVQSVGYPSKQPILENPVGPTITSILDLKTETLKDSYWIAEGAFPSMLSTGLVQAFTALSLLPIARRVPTDNSGMLRRIAREAQSNVQGPRVGSMDNTQMYLFMGHDDADGTMVLKEDRLRIVWPNVHRQHVYQKADQILYDCTKADVGIYIKNPLTIDANNNQLVTVHPLGGCPMGTSAENGVVNHKGQVFQKGTTVYENLYVLDGAILPTAVGVNPFFTICAIVERSIMIMAKEKNLSINYDPFHGNDIEDFEWV